MEVTSPWRFPAIASRKSSRGTLSIWFAARRRTVPSPKPLRFASQVFEGSFVGEYVLRWPFLAWLWSDQRLVTAAIEWGEQSPGPSCSPPRNRGSPSCSCSTWRKSRRPRLRPPQTPSACVPWATWVRAFSQLDIRRQDSARIVLPQDKAAGGPPVSGGSSWFSEGRISAWWREVAGGGRLRPRTQPNAKRVPPRGSPCGVVTDHEHGTLPTRTGAPGRCPGPIDQSEGRHVTRPS